MVLGVQLTEHNCGYVLDILADLEAAASETAFFLAPHPCKGRRRLFLGVVALTKEVTENPTAAHRTSNSAPMDPSTSTFVV